jgi:succinoglycan biosynthesis transport protein ExoP
MSDGTDNSRQRPAWRPAGRRDDAPGPRARRRAAAAQSEAPTFDLLDILSTLQRRFPVILGAVVVLTSLAAVYVSQLVPRYTSEAWVMLDTRHVRLGMEDMMSGLEIDAAAVQSEMDLIRSYPLAEKVAKELKLENEPEFNPSLHRVGFGDYVRHPVGFMLAGLHRLLSGSRPRTEAPALSPDDLYSGIAGALMGHVSVSTNGRSYLLRIRAEAGSPDLAAKIANAYANTYLLNQLELKYDAVRRTSSWLNEHLTELHDKLRDSENALQRFKEQHNITETRSGTVTAQQLTDLNAQLAAAAGDRALKEASLKTLQTQMSEGGAASPTLNSPLLQRLREQQAELMQRQAELATRYKPAHPTMVNLRAEMQDVERKIKQEIGKTMAELASEVAVARAREAALRTTLDGLQRSTDQQDQASIEARELEREAQANRVLYENFLSKFKQTSTQEDMQQPDARLVAPAMPPGGPSYPNRPMLITMSFVVSAVVGVLLAFLLERLDSGFRAGEQIERELGLRALGLVPDVGTAASPYKLVMDQPKALYSEAVRAVRTALRYINLERPPKVVVVTSSLPGEGKTVLSLSLARSVVRSGGKALIVDCDLRRPGIAKLTGCGTERSLLDLFDGAAPETLIMRDSESGLDVIPAKTGTANPQDVLGSQRMQAFLHAMRSRYDLVVLDAPPVLVVSDAVVLAHAADAALFLVRWEKSSRKSVAQGLRMLEADGASVIGAVITRVNTRQYARYGYRDSLRYNYYGEYGEPATTGDVSVR